MQYLINGRQMVVDSYGAGAALLLVHGLGGTANSWFPVVAAFAGSRRVIVPDLPGAGRSGPNPVVSIDSLVTDLLGLLDALDIPCAQVVGHSMGTVICQHLAARAPHRVLDLVLLGPLAEPPAAARPALRARAAAALNQGLEGIADTVCERGLAATTRARQPVVTGFVRELIVRQSPAGYAAHCLALAAAVKADPTLIQCRTLLLAGHEDTTSPPASPPSGPRSMIQSQARITSRLCSMTSREWPASSS